MALTPGTRIGSYEVVEPIGAGVFRIGPTLISGDGRSYVYSYSRRTDARYVVEGLE